MRIMHTHVPLQLICTVGGKFTTAIVNDEAITQVVSHDGCNEAATALSAPRTTALMLNHDRDYCLPPSIASVPSLASTGAVADDTLEASCG